MRLRSAIDTYHHWNLLAGIRAEKERRADPASLDSKLPGLHPDSARLLRKLKSSGVVAIPDYWSAEKCADARDEIDRLAIEYPDVVQRNSGGADKRMFGVESVSARLAEFHHDPLLIAVGERLGGSALYNFATLGARIDATTENNGSGDGWHRDAHDFQFKAILYLSDVGPENGPFEYVAGSQKKWRAIFDTAVGNLPSAPSTRYEPALVDRLLSRYHIQASRFLGKAGTLLLVNTTGIHRGRPLKAGSRYALTNYYYHPYQIDRARVQNFPTLMPGTADRIISDLQLP
ncbi:phytanoyl-CoA dioxygenase family protein [Bradyrhizobium sp. LjRoot220]|uniref:phytanoyl-CoA dioxygenase family protein n=1 Tax=Bradyrhizobium sp. LjRoot220 TaxID=3342284 RepID=UPI003ECF5F93